MTKTITIYNSMETLEVQIRTARGMYFETFRGEERGMSRKGRTNDEILEWTIKCYAEPNAYYIIREGE